MFYDFHDFHDLFPYLFSFGLFLPFGIDLGCIWASMLVPFSSLGVSEFEMVLGFDKFNPF